MDHSRRNLDRADPLRSVSRAVARGTFQVLRAPVRGCVRGVVREDAFGKRGSSSSDGGAIDLTDRCEGCGSPLPEGATVRRAWCGSACYGAHYRQMEREAREIERANDLCAGCGELIPATKRVDAIYCRKACRDRGRRHRLLTQSKACPHCRANFAPLRPDQVHCSRDCKNAERRQRQMIPCRGCGAVFRNRWGKRTQFCSQTCSSRFHYHAGRTSLPRTRLTAPRFDRLYG